MKSFEILRQSKIMAVWPILAILHFQLSASSLAVDPDPFSPDETAPHRLDKPIVVRDHSSSIKTDLTLVKALIEAALECFKNIKKFDSFKPLSVKAFMQKPCSLRDKFEPITVFGYVVSKSARFAYLLYAPGQHETTSFTLAVSKAVEKDYQKLLEILSDSDKKKFLEGFASSNTEDTDGIFLNGIPCGVMAFELKDDKWTFDDKRTLASTFYPVK